MPDQLENQLLQTVADTLDVPSGCLALSSGANTIDEWDSLAHLNIVLSVEEAFGVRFAPERIPELTSIEAIFMALKDMQEGVRP
jgi:acyl carrier protein